MSENIPTRREAREAAKTTEAETAKKPEPETKKAAVKQEPKLNLAGHYRVREGYSVAHGARVGDEEHTIGRHGHAQPGEIVYLTHEEALSVIRLTKDQRMPDGRPNGPAIETEEAYQARQDAELKRQEFEKLLADMNNFPDVPATP